MVFEWLCVWLSQEPVSPDCRKISRNFETGQHQGSCPRSSSFETGWAGFNNSEQILRMSQFVPLSYFIDYANHPFPFYFFQCLNTSMAHQCTPERSLWLSFSSLWLEGGFCYFMSSYYPWLEGGFCYFMSSYYPSLPTIGKTTGDCCVIVCVAQLASVPGSRPALV
jgi:hypothetical protein